MCKEETQHELMQRLANIETLLKHKEEHAADPISGTVVFSVSRTWLVDYRERKHIYFWSATGQILTIEDYGYFTVPAENWILFDMPDSARVTVPTLSGTSTATLFVKWTDELLPIFDQFISQAGYISLVSPQASTNAGSETIYTFAQEINTVNLQNNTGADVAYAFNTTATAGSLILADGQTLIYSKKITSVHLFTAGAQTVNATTANGIVLLGEL